MIDENKLIQTIILGSDWQEVMTSIVVEEGLDPLDIDIKKLADSFIVYLQRLKKFDFRIPARFILIAAILLRMKCELLLEEEAEKVKEEKEITKIDIENIPPLSPPIERMTTRKVTLTELITALNKSFEFREKKEIKKLRMRRAAESLIEPEIDIEIKIKGVFDDIMDGKTKFSDLVPVWKRTEIVETFMPLLYLMQRNKINCDQEEFFKEIYIRLKELDKTGGQL
ncbi:MAG: segregation/condensation protein A [Candidatus Aenigmatarchaeota archaeon]